MKTVVFRARRTWRELTRGRPPRLSREPGGPEPAGPVLAESRTLLYPSEVAAEFALQAGKVQNLRAAAAWLDGLRVGAGQTFSFWRHVGRPTRGRGFAAGRELREGCIVPSVGGGLCQLSNALYAAALDAGCEIVERHAHSRRVPGSMAAAGRDATVFWNYVDLRFRPPVDCRLEVRLTRRELVVRLRALAADALPRPLTALPAVTAATLPEVESCETCGVATCFRHRAHAHSAETHRSSGSRRAHGPHTAWLVDGWWPEFDRYLQDGRQPGDWLFLPLDGRRFRLCAYRWQAVGFARVRQAPRETLGRSWQSRRLAAQGATRQRALLAFDEALAARFARGLPPEALHLVVSQTLLPHLWRAGVLGGRTFDVFMTRLPMAELQETLDRAAARWPASPTLADFRAPAALVTAETAALAAARRWITPHSAVARLAGGRAEKLAWEVPAAARSRAAAGTDVWFPASTLGRKGAGELAAAARELGRRVQLGGPLLEGAGAWQGVDTIPARTDQAGVGVVVLPAWVEHQPRRLLAAVAAGLPVIASEACGLDGVPGVVQVPVGDADALKATLARHFCMETAAPVA
ncbi:MAG: VanW family protein [Gluconacetobacter diazotrophicus]|nr:VanW family protein [Gluconacetobacter diazotrophicus]